MLRMVLNRNKDLKYERPFSNKHEFEEENLSCVVNDKWIQRSD